MTDKPSMLSWEVIPHRPVSVSLAEEFARDLEKDQLHKIRVWQRMGSGWGDMRRLPRLILGDKRSGIGYRETHHRSFPQREDALNFYALLGSHPAQLWDHDSSDPGFVVTWFTDPVPVYPPEGIKSTAVDRDTSDRVMLRHGDEVIGSFHRTNEFKDFQEAYDHYSTVVSYKIAWAVLAKRLSGVYVVSYAFSTRYTPRPTWRQVSIPKNLRLTQAEKNRRKYGKRG